MSTHLTAGGACCGLDVGQGNTSQSVDRMINTTPVTTIKKGMYDPKYSNYYTLSGEMSRHTVPH